MRVASDVARRCDKCRGGFGDVFAGTTNSVADFVRSVCRFFMQRLSPYCLLDRTLLCLLANTYRCYARRGVHCRADVCDRVRVCNFASLTSSVAFVSDERKCKFGVVEYGCQHCGRRIDYDLLLVAQKMATPKSVSARPSYPIQCGIAR